jgi:hypothetical protein
VSQSRSDYFHKKVTRCPGGEIYLRCTPRVHKALKKLTALASRKRVLGEHLHGRALSAQNRDTAVNTQRGADDFVRDMGAKRNGTPWLARLSLEEIRVGLVKAPAPGPVRSQSARPRMYAVRTSDN